MAFPVELKQVRTYKKRAKKGACFLVVADP